jgi:hypothetical protein
MRLPGSRCSASSPLASSRPDWCLLLARRMVRSLEEAIVASTERPVRTGMDSIRLAGLAGGQVRRRRVAAGRLRPSARAQRRADAAILRPTPSRPRLRRHCSGMAVHCCDDCAVHSDPSWSRLAGCALSCVDHIRHGAQSCDLGSESIGGTRLARSKWAATVGPAS